MTLLACRREITSHGTEVPRPILHLPLLGRYNIPPTQTVLAVRQDEREADEDE